MANTKSSKQKNNGQNKKRARTRRSLSFEQRISVIKQHDKTQSCLKLAKAFKCSLNQIKNILRRKIEYMEEYENNGNLARMKRRQSARFVIIGVIVCEWLSRCVHYGIDITDEVIVLTAREISVQLKMAEVHPSNNWLERMRLRFKMSDDELRDIYGPVHIEKSLEIDDIIQDLKNYCTQKFNGTDSLTFPFELTQRYLRKTNEENSDLVKSRMKNCLTEMKSDKYLKINGGQSSNMNGFVKQEFLDDSDVDRASFVNDKQNFVKIEQCIPYEENEDKMENSLQELPVMGLIRTALTNGITSYKEAYNILGPLENFVLLSNDIEAVALINQLETHFRNKMKIISKLEM